MLFIKFTVKDRKTTVLFIHRETEKLKVEKVLAKNSISNRKLCNAARALLRPSLIAPVIDGKLPMLEPRPDRTSTNDVTHRNS